jgi:hypothetical protein
MKTQRKSKFPGRGTVRPVSPKRSLDLIRLNTEAIRKHELKAHARTERKLAELSTQLQQFHSEDRPGFLRWLHLTFGQILSRHREILNDIAAKQAIFRSVLELADRFNLSEIDAYRKHLHRQAHPDAALEEDRQWDEILRARQKETDPFSDEMDPPAEPGGEDPDDEHWEQFAEFFKGLFVSKTAKTEDVTPPTVRELYRILVRRLHPDRHGVMSEARKNLWHETQQAYQHKDVEALQGILARCEEGEAGLGAHTPVSAIRLLIARLSRSIRQIKKELRAAKKQTAWNYKEKIADPIFILSIRTELTARVRKSQSELVQLAWELEQIDRVARTPEKRTRSPRVPSGWR